MRPTAAVGAMAAGAARPCVGNNVDHSSTGFGVKPRTGRDRSHPQPARDECRQGGRMLARTQAVRPDDHRAEQQFKPPSASARTTPSRRRACDSNRCSRWRSSSHHNRRRLISRAYGAHEGNTYSHHQRSWILYIRRRPSADSLDTRGHPALRSGLSSANSATTASIALHRFKDRHPPGGNSLTQFHKALRACSRIQPPRRSPPRGPIVSHGCHLYERVGASTEGRTGELRVTGAMRTSGDRSMRAFAPARSWRAVT